MSNVRTFTPEGHFTASHDAYHVRASRYSSSESRSARREMLDRARLQTLVVVGIAKDDYRFEFARTTQPMLDRCDELLGPNPHSLPPNQE
jgi:hypothetical protein